MRPAAVRALLVILISTTAWATALFGAACAEDGQASTDEPDVSRPLPTSDSAAEEAEAAFDATDGASVDCTKTDFCPVEAPISPLVALNAVWGSSPNDIWVAGSRGTILHGDGVTFRSVPSGTDEIFYAVWGSGRDDVWITSSRVPRHARAEADGGFSWEPVYGATWNPDMENTGRIWTMWGSGPEDVWIAGSATNRFGDPGSIWTKTTIFSGDTVWQPVLAHDPSKQEVQPFARALWGTGPNYIWTVGYGGHAFVYRGPENGAPGIWNQRNARTTANLTGVWGTGRDNVWAVGQDGTIRHWIDDPSQSFQFAESPTKANLNAIWGSGASDIWAVGEHGTVIHYDGAYWAPADIGLQDERRPDLFGVWGSGPDDVWIVGDNVIVHRTRDSRRHP